MPLSSTGSQTLSFMLLSSAHSIALPVHATTGFWVLVDSSSRITVFVTVPQLFPSSFPSSCTALAQLSPSSPPALSQLFPSSCPRCCARVARVVRKLSQTLPDSPKILPDSPRLSQILPDSARFSYALPDSLDAPKFAQALTDSPKRCQTLPDSNALPVHATTGDGKRL